MAFLTWLAKPLPKKKNFPLSMLYLGYLNKEVQTNENI